MRVDLRSCPKVLLMLLSGMSLMTLIVSEGPAEDTVSLASLEQQFRTLPASARRLTGPLFWLHGDESPERLQMVLQKVAEGGNGSFTAESRPHNDWLGTGWYRDLGICLESAKKLDLKMWIFDERWWPSGEVDGRVPQEFGSKLLQATAEELEGPREYQRTDLPPRQIAVIAGRQTEQGIDGSSLIDLAPQTSDGSVRWQVPAGQWKVMVFSWDYSTGRQGRLLVDGASQDAVDWYLQTVYQPHYDHFADDFGRTIAGYFYDEPETYGDWGTEVIPLLLERGIDWKKALVAWKFQLAGPEQIAARYQYQDALAEAWGRTLYGGLTQWCHEHRVLSIGHFLEHGREYLHPRLCAGNMVQLQKYSDMGAIDAVFRQFVPGVKDDSTYQTPKLGSSISHAYGKTDDLAMVEIFGARGQDLTYPEMKWWTDHMHVSGINFHIPHSFNPRAPYDRDCPPYFYDGGYEPRWPLYRVYADYTSRLSLMLSGGHHVCPVALLYLGNSYHVGQATTPEQMTTALQDALIDCDWLPYDVFEQDTSIAGDELQLRQERYRVVIVPSVEVIPHATLAKVKAFFDAGGVVVAYGRLPTQSATLGQGPEQIGALCRDIWGPDAQPSLHFSRRNSAGGRCYFLPAEPTPQQLQQVLVQDAGVQPTVELLEGQTDDWLHVLHRVKAQRDLFLICNQQPKGAAKRFKVRVHASGEPECWDAMRNEITSIRYTRGDAQTVDFSLRLEPLESMLIVFQPQAIERPLRIETDVALSHVPLNVQREPSREKIPNRPPPKDQSDDRLDLSGCPWVWFPEQESGVTAPPGMRCFRQRIDLPADVRIVGARMRLTADNSFRLYVNGQEVASSDNWQVPLTVDLTEHLSGGSNVLAIAAQNGAIEPNPAGLIGRYWIRLDSGQTLTGCIDASWKCSDREQAGWMTGELDDQGWPAVRKVADFGDSPWGSLDDAMLTLSPVTADPFSGRFSVPDEWLTGKPRLYLEADGVQPEAAAAVKLNGQYIGGFIGRPFRLEITAHVKAGENTLQIQPFAPVRVRIVNVAATP